MVEATSNGKANDMAEVSGSNDSLPATPSIVEPTPMEPGLDLSMRSTTDDVAMSAGNDPAADPSPAPEEVLDAGIPPGTPVVTTRTNTRRGADTTVKRSGGTGAQLGENITVMVQTRGKVDVQHAYLRFDLEAIKKDSQGIGDVELVLSLPGGAAPAGSSVRVYGVPEEYPDAWSEAGPQALYWDNSTSKSELEGIPLLAEVSLSGDEATPTLRIHDQRMTDFVQSIQEKVVTLVLAGGSPGDKALHFVSREGSQEQAPALDFVIKEKSDKRK